jgi:hypothetical protein
MKKEGIFVFKSYKQGCGLGVLVGSGQETLVTRVDQNLDPD